MGRRAEYNVRIADGRFVDYSLKRRSGDPYYFVTFRGLDGRRLERSTGQGRKKKNKAMDVAISIIQETYSPKTVVAKIAWDEAIAAMTREMRANNNRERTIQDYQQTLSVLRKEFPDAGGPGDITDPMAKLFKVRRMEAGKSAHTVRTDLITLSSIWQKWWINVCGLMEANPWEKVELPKVDEVVKRFITVEEEQVFFAWLSERWDGWRLPILFFTVKGLLGCRILQLSSVETIDLRDGRLFLTSETAKGRKVRNPKLPQAIYAELKELAGTTYLWERYSEQLAGIHRSRKRRAYVKEFRPTRLTRWLQDQVTDFREAHADQPGFRPFTAHNFRGTAISTAINGGASTDEAATAFLCHPATIKAHYLVQDRTVVEDRTLELVYQARLEGHRTNGKKSKKARNGA